MRALDLTLDPPRSPRLRLAQCDFLPRSIDKVRATLPGGNLGDYKLGGTTELMLQTLGISLPAFTAAVAAAGSEADVATFIEGQTTSERVAEWNATLALRQPRGGNRAEAIAVYPWLAERPDMIFLLDVLEEDDRR